MPSSGCSRGGQGFDVIVVDFPDPTNFSIGKLYTNSFYALLDKRLAASGYAVVQPPRRWWRPELLDGGADHRIVGLTAALPRHVPSFGEWGFVLASRRPGACPMPLPRGCGFEPQTLPLLFDFPLDMARCRRGEPPVQPGAGARYEREWGQGGGALSRPGPCPASIRRRFAGVLPGADVTIGLQSCKTLSPWAPRCWGNLSERTSPIRCSGPTPLAGGAVGRHGGAGVCAGAADGGPGPARRHRSCGKMARGPGAMALGGASGRCTLSACWPSPCGARAF